jgi:hypothetical protein
MTDPYVRDERIAIRTASGMSESRAIELTDSEIRKAAKDAQNPKSITKLRALHEQARWDKINVRGTLTGIRKVLATGERE